MGGQGLNGWSISFLEIWKIKIMIHGCSNGSLPCLDKEADPRLIPKYCQSINNAGNENVNAFAMFWPVFDTCLNNLDLCDLFRLGFDPYPLFQGTKSQHGVLATY